MRSLEAGAHPFEKGYISMCYPITQAVLGHASLWDEMMGICRISVHFSALCQSYVMLDLPYQKALPIMGALFAASTAFLDFSRS
ncbi:hypothetical protein K5D34_02415 [Pseudomonas cichorii]|uniref:Uncharacterized protein n=1 Tax=Pseudomonas lijiangensis TaxID=2995658 RepID=A0ABX8HVZ5_9PSED|nr:MULTISPECIES: hypothetical protein [Pseudomonas syringae group]MBX8490559.1 hypothetical protein [Pseudomonas cichorii]MBX8504068.1 hypothetical protein [Pseudomonas lijiangensis]MBX8508544.1 hypothetical protein [Pseudomonas cichorii]MBX8523796.1 hypothetical protein [Pseudomonas cichorii]MBX8570862.1 hypothetical protein [Pseudomonas cichorii]